MIQKLKNIKIEDFANNVDRLRLYRLEQIKKSEPLKKNIIKIFRLSLVVLSFILILFILYQSKNNYITSLYSVLIPIFLFVTAYFISKNSILKKQKLTFHNDSENSVIGFPDSNCLNDFPDELIINSKNSGDILADKEREQNFSCFFEANFFESFKWIFRCKGRHDSATKYATHSAAKVATIPLQSTPLIPEQSTPLYS